MIVPIANAARMLACAALAVVAAFAPLTAHAQTPFTFIAVGDAGQPGDAHLTTATAVTTVAKRLDANGTPLDLLMFLGDNFYPSGLNDAYDDWIGLRDEVLAPYLPVMRRLGRENVRAVAGNHDYYCRAVNTIPYGFCVTGNEREQAIPEWTYDYYMPTSIRRATVDGGSDSVEFILFDSAFLLTRPTIFWKPTIDSLARMLQRSSYAKGVRWRIIVAHHSLRTVGEHAGWRRWNARESRVGYIGNCLQQGQDPFRYVYEFFSTQDNCSNRYRHYVDTLNAVVARSGARVQAILAGHDHSLQLLHDPKRGCDLCPKVMVISGSGSKRDRVKSPAPPFEFTHPLNDDANRGRSVQGFVVGAFEGSTLRLEFIDGRDASTLDMGGGRTRFHIDEAGSLLDAR